LKIYFSNDKIKQAGGVMYDINKGLTILVTPLTALKINGYNI